MKTLMTMVAALAISSAVNAQVTECAVSSECGTFTRGYDVIIRTVRDGATLNILNRRTGELLDTFECEGSNLSVQCGLAGEVAAPTAPSTDVTPSTTRTISRRSSRIRRRVTNNSDTTTSSSTETPSSSTSTRRGFPASAAIGLP